MVAIDVAKVVFSLVKDRNDVVTHECVVLVVIREKHERLQKMLPRDEVAGCLSVLRVAVDIAKVGGDIKVFLCVADPMHLIHIQLGTLGLRK